MTANCPVALQTSNVTDIYFRNQQEHIPGSIPDPSEGLSTVADSFCGSHTRISSLTGLSFFVRFLLGPVSMCRLQVSHLAVQAFRAAYAGSPS